MMLGEHPAYLLPQRLRQGVEAGAGLGRRVARDAVVEQLVRGARDGEVGTRVDHPVDPVFHRRPHHVVAAPGAYVESKLGVLPEHGQVHDGVHPLGGGNHLTEVARVHLQVLVVGLRGLADVRQAEVVFALQGPHHVRSQHPRCAQYQYVHGNPPTARHGAPRRHSMPAFPPPQEERPVPQRRLPFFRL